MSCEVFTYLPAVPRKWAPSRNPNASISEQKTWEKVAGTWYSMPWPYARWSAQCDSFVWSVEMHSKLSPPWPEPCQMAWKWWGSVVLESTDGYYDSACPSWWRWDKSQLGLAPRIPTNSACLVLFRRPKELLQTYARGRRTSVECEP